MLRVLMILIPVAVSVYALIDAIMAPRAAVRLMPKWTWIVVIVLLWLGGAVLWFFLGRPRAGKSGAVASTTQGGNPPKYPRTQHRPMGPDDDPDFLSGLGNRKPDSGK